MNNEIRTTQYEWSHGRKPRGKGHWWFEQKQCTRGRMLQAPGPCTYGEAKRWLQKELTAQGCKYEVWDVCP